MQTRILLLVVAIEWEEGAELYGNSAEFKVDKNSLGLTSYRKNPKQQMIRK